MAKRRKTAKRSTAKRRTTRASRAARSETFNPSGWLSSLMNSQTGRVIAAEALVAAAGAAAAVLVASRTEGGRKAGRAMARAAGDTTEMMKEAARSAANAAGEVIGNMSADAIGNVARDRLGERTGEMVGAVARSFMTRGGRGTRGRRDAGESQFDMTQKNLAQKAMQTKRNGRNPRSRPRANFPPPH
jgi:mRNA-degrading endonuclease toxin of MazEF toxin-antitoxin module